MRKNIYVQPEDISLLEELKLILKDKNDSRLYRRGLLALKTNLLNKDDRSKRTAG